MSETLLDREDEGPKLLVCESTLMPVADEYTYIHHSFIDLGVFRYIEKAP
ncbi:hypothetical protein HRbin01_00432 [archaeon HR01]|nr:hypothetical protein HRbin01_00432 [archaeon HR01]